MRTAPCASSMRPARKSHAHRNYDLTLTLREDALKRQAPCSFALASPGLRGRRSSCRYAAHNCCTQDEQHRIDHDPIRNHRILLLETVRKG